VVTDCGMLDDPLTWHCCYLLGNHRTWIKRLTSRNTMILCFTC